MTEDPLQRITISLPQSLLVNFDRMVAQRGYDNRSRAVVEVLNREIVDYGQELGDRVMAGTITIVYGNEREGTQARLSAIQRKYIAEVISSLHVQLEHRHTMEVLLVQGPGTRLREIADELTACSGVTTGKLSLSATILPPIRQNEQS
jgi:CopG family transcriptional regulator, nickel-responsive regulator